MTKMAALLVLVLAPQGETYNRPDRRSPGGQGALEGLARAIGPFRAVVLVAHVHMIDDSSIDDDVYVLYAVREDVQRGHRSASGLLFPGQSPPPPETSYAPIAGSDRDPHRSIIVLIAGSRIGSVRPTWRRTLQHTTPRFLLSTF